jgi:hypothetical protein
VSARVVTQWRCCKVTACHHWLSRWATYRRRRYGWRSVHIHAQADRTHIGPISC